MKRKPRAPVRWWNRARRVGNVIVCDLDDVHVVIRALSKHKTHRLVGIVDSTEAFTVDDIMEAA